MDRVFALAQGAFACRAETPDAYDVDAPPGGAYRVKILPALSDNYMYLVISGGECVAVDPVDSAKVLRVCEEEGVRLAAVLVTHYHDDHSGGNAALSEALPGLEVLTGEGDAGRTPAVTRALGHGEEVALLEGGRLRFRCLATPCHTRGHVAFFLDAGDGQAPALFSGDTLFVAGCGRFMEGGPADMQASLARLLALPPATRLFCGHEYTVGNLQYAASVEPGNEAVTRRLEEARRKRDALLPTVPSTLAEELEHNPFLRTTSPEIAESMLCAPCDPLAVMGKLRRGKDTFTTVGKVITLALDVKSFFQRDAEPGDSGGL